MVDSPRVTTSVSTPPQRPVKETPTSQKSPTKYNSLYTVLDTPLPLSLIGSLPGGLPSTPDLSTVAGKPPASQPAVEDAGLSQSHQRESIPSSIGTAPPVISLNSSGKTYCVSCNNCARSIPGEHYHCSICDGGDYDLCMHCVNAGISCPAEKHWLIKRFVQDGYVSSSTTESANSRNSQDKGKCGKKPSQQSFTEPVAKEVTDPLMVPSAHTVRREVCNACLQGKMDNVSLHDLRCHLILMPQQTMMSQGWLLAKTASAIVCVEGASSQRSMATTLRTNSHLLMIGDVALRTNLEVASTMQLSVMAVIRYVRRVVIWSIMV